MNRDVWTKYYVARVGQLPIYYKLSIPAIKKPYHTLYCQTLTKQRIELIIITTYKFNTNGSYTLIKIFFSF